MKTGMKILPKLTPMFALSFTWSASAIPPALASSRGWRPRTQVQQCKPEPITLFCRIDVSESDHPDYEVTYRPGVQVGIYTSAPNSTIDIQPEAFNGSFKNPARFIPNEGQWIVSILENGKIVGQFTFVVKRPK